ncbi:MAG: hypothetical protein WC600_04620 [Desulfobaccales bacterium]
MRRNNGLPPNPLRTSPWNDADSFVLLVQVEQPIRILACLDQSYISQDSLEMINQMVRPPCTGRSWRSACLRKAP